MQEACDLIRGALHDQGFTERDLFHVESSFDWQQLLYSASSMSLFGDRKLIELRMPTGKPGNQGGSILQEYVERLSADRVLLIVTDRLDRASQNTNWFKRVSGAGAYVEVRQIELKQLAGWLNERIRQGGMSADREAVYALMEKVEGNLLAAVQEIERIRLITGGGRIDVGAVTDGVGDSSRYTIYGLVDAALSGNGKRTLRILQGLQDEGTAVLQIAFVLGREIRQLVKMSAEAGSGRQIDNVMRNNGVWSSRTAMVGAALRRHGPARFEQMLLQLARLDKLAKGAEGENPWDLLQEIAARLAGIRIATSAAPVR
jgi:DNA polymerase-3 subunit delta